MPITQAESHRVAVLAGQASLLPLRALVHRLAAREDTSPGDILLSCRDDFQQTAAHIAAKAGQTRAIDTLGELFGTDDARKAAFFDMANRFSGDRAVHTAMRHGWLDVLRCLVRHGADPTAANRFGDTVLDYEGDYEPGEVREIVKRYRDGWNDGLLADRKGE